MSTTSTKRPKLLKSGDRNPKIDRKGWPPGPWDDEPDHFEWKTAAGLPAIAHRASGYWCGYVAVYPGHPVHANGCDEATDAIRVHGGFTYGGACQGDICHVPEPGEPDDVMWLGFDCAHCGDSWPTASGEVLRNLPGEVPYRTLEYVKAECESVAVQLQAMVG